MRAMTCNMLTALLLFGALAAIDAATADLDLVALIDVDAALAVDAAVLADALAAEADALRAVIARRIGS
jgi:hypothetical protein